MMRERKPRGRPRQEHETQDQAAATLFPPRPWVPAPVVDEAPEVVVHTGKKRGRSSLSLDLPRRQIAYYLPPRCETLTVLAPIRTNGARDRIACARKGAARALAKRKLDVFGNFRDTADWQTTRSV